MQTFAQPAQTLAQVGAAETARAQQPITEAMQRFAFEQAAPAEALTRYGNVVAGSILPGTVSQTGGMAGPSTLANMAGGALTGAALGAPFGGSTFMTSLGPWGAAAGALYGLLS
jgi:hypothetical protein